MGRLDTQSIVYITERVRYLEHKTTVLPDSLNYSLIFGIGKTVFPGCRYRKELIHILCTYYQRKRPSSQIKRKRTRICPSTHKKESEVVREAPTN